jgi:hypothetical protein
MEKLRQLSLLVAIVAVVGVGVAGCIKKRPMESGSSYSKSACGIDCTKPCCAN